MPNAKDIEMKLPSLDELFSSQKERDDAKLKRIYEIPLDEIDPFPDHPFKVRDDEDMTALVESIRTSGVLTPATVRKKEDGRYELLSGHRRLRACQLADVTDQFTQNPEFFTIPKLKDVKFDGEGTWNNKGKDEFIANITLEPGEKAVVTYTAVVNDNAKEYLAAKAKDSDSLDDRGHDTNREYQKNETDDKDGYWNTAYCDNVTYPNPDNPDEPGTLEPKDDVAQTPVQKPEIGTTLTGDKKAKEVDPCKETTLTDVVEYKALNPSKDLMRP